jgi:hypothetical protein
MDINDRRQEIEIEVDADWVLIRRYSDMAKRSCKCIITLGSGAWSPETQRVVMVAAEIIAKGMRNK